MVVRQRPARWNRALSALVDLHERTDLFVGIEHASCGRRPRGFDDHIGQRQVSAAKRRNGDRAKHAGGDSCRRIRHRDTDFIVARRQLEVRLNVPFGATIRRARSKCDGGGFTGKRDLSSGLLVDRAHGELQRHRRPTCVGKRANIYIDHDDRLRRAGAGERRNGQRQRPARIRQQSAQRLLDPSGGTIDDVFSTAGAMYCRCA